MPPLRKRKLMSELLDLRDPLRCQSFQVDVPPSMTAGGSSCDTSGDRRHKRGPCVGSKEFRAPNVKVLSKGKEVMLPRNASDDTQKSHRPRHRSHKLVWSSQKSMNRSLSSHSRTEGFFSPAQTTNHKRPVDGMLMGSSSRSPDGEGPVSRKYSDRLSPAIKSYLSEASRQEVRPFYAASTSAFVPTPAATSTPAQQPTIVSQAMMYDKEGVRAVHSMQSRFLQGDYSPPQNSLPVHHLSPSQLMISSQYAELVEKADNMGYGRDFAASMIYSMEESGQPLDFNTLFGRIMHPAKRPPVQRNPHVDLESRLGKTQNFG